MGVGAAAIVGGSAIVGGGLSYLGSRSQSRAASQAGQIEWEMYRQNRNDLKPWTRAGRRSLEDLERVQTQYEGVVQDPRRYEESPGFEWLKQQGIDTLNRGASASGALDSGARSKDLISYGQGLALQDYGGYLGRLESLMNRYAGTANVGQTAVNTTIQAGQAGAQGRANQAINQSNARTGLYQNLANIGTNAANQYLLYNNLQGGGSSQGSPQNLSQYDGFR